MATDGITGGDLKQSAESTTGGTGDRPHSVPTRPLYERVSTARQGESGLGLEAQRKSIDVFARYRHAVLLGCFTEVESGKNPDRPELAKALHPVKVTGSTLIIAKIDRVSRNAAFLLTLRTVGALLACDSRRPMT